MTDVHSHGFPGRLETVCAVGDVADLVVRRNSRGEQWAEFTLTSRAGVMTCVCFPKDYPRLVDRLVAGRSVRLWGQVASTCASEMRVTGLLE